MRGFTHNDRSGRFAGIRAAAGTTAVVGLTTLFATTGCGGGTSAGGAPNAGGSTSGGGASTSSASGGRTLVDLEPSVAPSLDPEGPTQADPALHQTYDNLMEPLVEFPTKGIVDGVQIPNYGATEKDFVPALAQSWTHTGTTWTFTLRKGVMSCAGNELTSKDVLYTFERGKSVTGAAPNFDFLATVTSIFDGSEAKKGASAASKQVKDSEVKILGKYDFQIKQRQPNDLLLPVFTTFGTMIWDSTEMKKHATASDPWSHNYTDTVNAPGFGAYCLKKWVKGNEIDLTANPKYYKGQPAYTNIVIRQTPADSNRTAAIIGGQADITDFLTPQQYSQVNKSGGKALTFSNNREYSLGVNYKYPPFNDLAKGKLLRQAIAYAIPYDQIIKQNFLGNAVQSRGLVAGNSFGWTPINTYNTSLDKAKALMAQAGYPGGKGLPKDSPAFKLFYPAESSAVLQPIANEIRTALGMIGMPVTLNPIPQSQEASREITTWDLGMFLRTNLRPLVPDVGYAALLFYVSKGAGGLVPSTNYASAEMDKLYKQSASSVGQQRLDVLAKIQTVLMDDLPLIPIVQPKAQLAVKAGGPTAWWGNSYDTTYFWYLKPANS